MPDLRWTTEPPTVAGWYWVRGHDGTHSIHEVYRDQPPDDSSMLCVSLPRGDLIVGDTTGSAWAGPIPEPQDESEEA